MSRDRVEIRVGQHQVNVDVPSELVTGDEALLFAQRLRTIAGHIEMAVKLRDALANPANVRCGCPSCTARRAAAN